MLALCHAALAALLLSAAPGFDTVLLQNGGRLVGTVVEENPATGVTVQIPGGQLRTVPVAEVFRIEYRDGTFGVVGAHPKPAAPPGAAPPGAAPPAAAAPVSAPLTAAPPAEVSPAEAGPPAAPPPPPEAGAPPPPIYPAYPVRPPPPHFGAGRFPAGRPAPYTFAFGLGFAAPSGNVEPGLHMRDVFGPQFLVELEAGLRLTPHLTGSLLLDMGFGQAGRTWRDSCQAFGGNDCTAMAGSFGLQLRYTLRPYAQVTPWISLGTGVTVGILSFDQVSSSNDVTWSGWQVLRAGVGVDFRTSSQLGWGFFLATALGRYDEVEDSTGTSTIRRKADHAWVQGGVRLILFP